jgi:His/Glu/Gln/Arg/opine family amino acid ABC transporter permease subunit
MLDVAFMIEILPRVLRAALVTLQLSFLSLFFSIILGLVFSTLALSSGKLMNILIRCFVEFTRGVPQLVQISIIYFALPYIGIYFDEFWTGVVALSFIGAGYTIEIFRNAVLNIEKGQHEAGKILGLNNFQILIYVLYPQIIKRSLPPITNELINVVKASALLSVISVNEITKIMNDVIFEYFVVIEVLIEATVMYLIIISALVALSRYFERKLVV